MTALDDFRQLHPQYNEVPDATLADALYNKFYSSIPREDFNRRIGFTPPVPLGEAVAEMWNKPPEGPSLIGMAKSMYEGFRAPGDAAAGAFTVQPETPGQWSEEDEFRAQHAKHTMNERAAGAAAGALTGSLPRAFVGQGGRDTLGMGFSRPGQPQGATPTPPPPMATPATAGELVETAGRIGVEIPRFMADPSRMTQGVAAGLKNIPGAGDRIAQATEGTVRGLGEATTRVSEGYGTGSPAVAGGVAKDALSEWIAEGSKRVANRLYDAVDASVNPIITTELKTTARVAQGILDQRANARIPGKSAAVDTVLDAITVPGGLNYQGAKALRSYLGEMTPEQLAASGLRNSEVKQLYGALTVDLRNTIQNAGGAPAVAKFERANRLFESIVERRNALGKIIGTKGDAAPEAVFSRLAAMAGSKSSADLSLLVMARKAIGAEGWNEMASAMAARLGRDTRGEFSIPRFLTAYGGMTPAGRSALFSTTGRDNLGRALNDIAKVSKEIEAKLEQFANPSGTARSLTATGMVMDVIHHPIRALSALTGGNYLAKVLSEPASAQLTAQWLQAYRNALVAPSANSSKAVQTAAGRLANEIVKLSGGGNAAQIASQLSVQGLAFQPPQ